MALVRQVLRVLRLEVFRAITVPIWAVLCVVLGAVVLANPHGTAPGLWIEHGDSVIALLPGPPREMKPMMDGQVRDRLGAKAGATRLPSPVWRRGRPRSQSLRRLTKTAPTAMSAGSPATRENCAKRPARTAARAP